MGKVRILPEQLVNQIAAGEVVDRAASALKELIENSLDAGATKIQIIVRGHGRELIQIIDDGSGMSREDLHLAFERHATSKLGNSSDLWQIRTLGFRGEALPSIASVSYVETRTRAAESPTGTLLRLQGGNIVHEEPVPMPCGTSISIHSLFYNTPARASFLKSPATELSHLIRVFRQYAVAYPHVAWTFGHDTTVEYTLPSADFATRLDDLFGAGFSRKTTALEFDQAGVKVTGAIGGSELFRKSRGDQYIFLNSRPIQSPFIHSAVKAAFREQLEPGVWPFYVLLIEIDPARVDVNVHPSKQEVKFADEKLIHSAVYRAARNAQPGEFISALSDLAPAPASAPSYYDYPAPLTARTAPDFNRDFFSPRPTEFPAPPPIPGSTHPDESEQINEAYPIGEPQIHEPLLRPAIFQVHQKYLISQIRSGLAIIDQHAAHERVLYEKALSSFSKSSFQSQQLLFPLLLELSIDEDAHFADVRTDMVYLGFQIRDFGLRIYSVEAVPAGLKRASETSMIHNMLEEYKEFRRLNFSARDALAASFACKTAIRTGDSLSAEEMAALVDQLFATQFPLTCPHGRPTVIHVKLSELDRRFKRTE